MAWAERTSPYANAAFPPSANRADKLIGGRAPATVQASRVNVTEPQRKWASAVKARLNELCALTRGWDGYNAPAVSFSNAQFALNMLETCCISSMPVPSIVPGIMGDLQIEWHLAGGDIELHVRGPYDVHAWRQLGGGTDEGEEIELRSVDFTVVDRWVRELLEYPIAARAAAA